MADEAVYTAGYNIMSHLGKGKAIMGLHVTSILPTDTITTPFMRCVPVVTAAVGAAAGDDPLVTESAGVVTINAATSCATAFQAIIFGDLY